ncbi:MAG: efflux RND transporter permease subunit [Bacteroidota bacterium]
MKTTLEKLLRIPRWVFFVMLIISVGLFMKMKENAEMETDLDEYMPQDHPAFVYSDKAEEWFDIKDGIIVAVEDPRGIYNSETLDTLKQMTRAFQKMDEIKKDDVTSLYTADNITGTEMGLDVEPFFTTTPTSESELAQLQKAVETNEMTHGRLVSEGGNVSVIIAEIEDDVFTQDFYDRILKTVDGFETGDIKVHVAGRPIVEGTMALLAPADMKRMVPIVLVIIVLTLYLMLRSIKGTVLTMSVVLFSVIWAFGVMAWLGIPIYAVTTMMPVMLVAIGVADGIHLFSHLQLFMQKNPNAGRREAIADMIRGMWKPVMMTSVTTSVGFISLLTSEVYPIKYFGIFTAFGVMTAMLFSLVFIPAGLMIFGLPKVRTSKKPKRDQVHPLAERFTNKVLKYKPVSIIVTAVIIALSLVGMEKVWINSSFLEKFEEDSEIVQTDQFINEHFGGTTNINLILDAGENGNDVFKKPEVLNLINQMQHHVEDSLDVVGSSFGLTDYLRRMNKVMHADDEAYNRIPNSKEMVAQYLLLYEMSGDPEDLNQVVDYDYAKVNVTFQLKSDNTKAINSTLDIIDSYSVDFADHGVEINYAGSGYTGLVFTDLILEGQIKSLILSLAIIILLLSLMFRNIKVGFIGAVPIMATAFIGFGVMGFLNIPLNTTTALLASIAIGIGIDYAVHFLQQYRVNARLTGDKYLTAQKTMNHTGRAISFNAIVVIAGFLVLLFSVFPPNRQLGALVSLNMFTSFVGTVTVMMVLLHKLNIWFGKKK